MFTRKDLVKLLAPLIIEQILAVLVGMVDVVMVAAVGETAVSGVSLVDAINMLIIQMLAALATGGAVVSAQFIGRKDTEKACKAAGQLISVTTMASVGLMTFALVTNRSLLRQSWVLYPKKMKMRRIVFMIFLAIQKSHGI